MQTIAQQIKWNFAKEGDLVIRNAKGNLIYYETSDGFWSKSIYNEKGNVIYHENSNGVWSKREYDEKGNEIYRETSDGVIEDNRPKCENKVVDIDGVKYKLVKL